MSCVMSPDSPRTSDASRSICCCCGDGGEGDDGGVVLERGGGGGGGVDAIVSVSDLSLQISTSVGDVYRNIG